MSAFIHQGGYAYFVWSVYGMAALLLLGETLYLWYIRNTRRRRLRRRPSFRDQTETT